MFRFLQKRTVVSTFGSGFRLNKVQIVGNITADPTFRATGVPEDPADPSHASEEQKIAGYWNFVIAEGGGPKETNTANFWRVSYRGFSRSMESETLKKGKKVFVEGRLNSVVNPEKVTIVTIKAREIRAMPFEKRVYANADQNENNN